VTALSFITFVELNNPIVIFKCNRACIRERIEFYAESGVVAAEEKEEKKEKKAVSLKEKLWQEAMAGPDVKEQFFEMIKTPEPELMLGNESAKKVSACQVVKSEYELIMD